MGSSTVKEVSVEKKSQNTVNKASPRPGLIKKNCGTFVWSSISQQLERPQLGRVALFYSRNFLNKISLVLVLCDVKSNKEGSNGAKN